MSLLVKRFSDQNVCTAAVNIHLPRMWISFSLPSWLVDKSRFASKIRCASGTSDHENTNWTSNPSRACPNCQHIISNDEVTQDWPGLPRGVKFDPSDQEIIWHLLAKVGHANMQPHPFIDEFIPTVNQEDGICYTHPQNLPGVKQDGVASHFFHRAIKAYSTGTRKRRKINGDDLGDVRWHKTGRTKPVIIEGDQRGCKKIMVLYVNPTKGGKAEKTNWVMHQYHLGTEEDEKDGQYVISKVFYQQQQVKQSDKTVGDVPELIVDVVAKLDPVTPKSITPDPPRSEMRASFVPGEQSALSSMEYVADEYHNMGLAVSMGQTEQKDEVEVETELGEAEQQHGNVEAGEVYEYESQYVVDSQQLIENLTLFCDSQNILDSQQLVENISLIDEFDEDNAGKEAKAGLSSAYAQLGPEDLKRDLEYCQNPTIDPSNIDLDTPPDFRLSQLDFGSQDSFAWIGSSKILD